MKRVVLSAPFTQGMITDVPDHQIGPQNSSFAQDGYSPSGVWRQRAGWAYDGSTADVVNNLVSVYRAKFALSDETRTMTIDDDGVVYIHAAAGVGTAVGDPAAGTILFRCVYGDQLVGCYQDGTTPIILYSGANIGTDDVTTAGSVANTATITASVGTWLAGSTSGAYKRLLASTAADYSPTVWARILERNSSSSLTIEGVKFSTTGTNAGDVSGVGWTYPCVNVYNAGTGSFNTVSDVFTGVGTKWTTAGVRALVSDDDALLGIKSTGAATAHRIFEVATETELNLGDVSQSDTNINYAILRRCPFKDAAAHKESLWGAGVAQYPSRVYVGPPGWNPALPPGFEVPYDTDILTESENVNDFLLNYSDVPSSIDSDHIVAILSTPNPLLVLKRNSVYAVTGDYFGRSIDLIADGIGCIDIRSAWSYDEGQFWAGENGIFWYSNGSITDLTRGKINREWRALTRDFNYTTDYCTLFVSSGHLIVHITTSAGTVQRTFMCDLRDQSWQCRLTNVAPRFAFTSRIAGEKEKAFWVSDARQGRVMDFAPALDGSGTADDDAGTAPRMKAYTTSAIAQSGGIDGLTRLVDLHVNANVYDAGAAASTQLEVSVVSGGGTSNQANSTKTLDTINSDTVDRIDRHTRRVARRGRFHQVQFDVDTTGTDTAATKVEIHSIIARVKELRGNA